MRASEDDTGMARRDFLRTAALLPVAVALGCSSDAGPAEIEVAIRKFILAIGPWDESQRDEAEVFATRFLAARSGSFRAQGDAAVSLARQAPFNTGRMRIPELDLVGRSPEERKMLTDFVGEIYSLLAVHYVVAGRPPIGQCAGRVQYTRPPGEWEPPYRKPG